MKINKLIDKCIEDNVDVMKVHIDVLYEYAKEYNALEQENKQLKVMLQEIYERAINTNITSLNFRDYILEILGDKDDINKN